MNGADALEELSCWSETLKTLDVSGLKSLRRLACNGGLQTLTVNGADKLEVLDCSRNKLTALDVSELETLAETGLLVKSGYEFDRGERCRRVGHVGL